MSTNYVIINSKYREASGSKSTSDFIYSIGESLEVSSVAVKSISMVNSEYNVRENYNTLLGNIGGPTDTPLVFPVGQYTVIEIMAQLVTLLNAWVGGTNTAVKNNLTGKIEITTTTAIKFKTDLITSPVAQLLGLGDQPGFYPAAVSTTINATFLPALQGSNNYHICSNILGQGQGSLLVNNKKRAIISTIPSNVDFGGIIHYESTDIELNKRVFNRPINIQTMDIKVLDDDSQIVNLNGSNIEIVLQVDLEKVGDITTFGN
jgi:hypothetical protein